MNANLNSAFMDDPEFQSLMIECLESLQRGKGLDRDAIKTNYPKYADNLDQYLDVLQVLDKFTDSFQNVSSRNAKSSPYEATLIPHKGRDDIELGNKLRYIGEYEVLEEIARGGMGVVFKARQESLKRTVALKMILSGRLADKTEVERFRREAQAASRLQHPNIVGVHEIGEHDGRQYFTMDFVEGHSLADAIREESLPPKRAARLVQIAAEAVQYAHGKGTLHRDLKPANILLTADDTPHVTDFGLAKILDEVDDESRAELTASGQILGTPSYMSPEQADGKLNLVSAAADIYSLGAILYACLTGRAPFVADSPVDTLMQVIHKEPVSPRQLNPSVPQDLETICLKCLNKEPHKRYGTAQELADDLQRFLEGRPVQARPIGRAARAARWAKRNPVVASLMCLAAISLMAGTAISSYFAVEANKRAIAEANAKVRQAELRGEAEDLAEDLKDSLTRETELKGDAVKAQNIAEEKWELSKRAMYALQLSRSYELWASNPVEGLEGLNNTKRCPPEFRDFSWRYLSELSERFVRSYTAHQTPFCLDVSSDGTLIAGCYVTSDIHIISRESGKSWNVKEKAKKWVNKVAFLPDSHMLVSCGSDPNLTVWDAMTGDKLQAVELGEETRGLAVSPDGNWVATGGKKTTYLVRTSDWKVEKQFAHGASELTFTRDSQVLIAGNGNKIRFQNLESGETETWEGQKSPVRGLDVSPDNKILLSSDFHSVLLRDLKTGQVLHRINEPLNKAEFDDVKFSPDGNSFVTTAGVYPIKMWDVKTGQFIAEVSPYIGSTSTFAFFPDGHHIVTPAEHDQSKVNVWKVPRKDPTHTVLHPALWMAASPDEHLLASTDQSKIDLWDTRTAEIIHSWIPEETAGVAGAITDLLFVPDESKLISLHRLKKEGIAAIWDVETGKLIRKLEGLGSGKSMAYDPVHNQIAVSGSEKVVSLRDFETGEERRVLPSYYKELQSIEFSPDGKWLAYGDGWDPLPDGTAPGKVTLCNLEDDKVITLEGHRSYGIYDLAFSPDGNTLYSVAGEGILWDVHSGKMKARMQGHQSAIFSIDVSPDGKTLVTGSMDKTLRLWDPVTAELRLTLEGHPLWVTAAAFNHDGTQLMSSSYDGQLKFWFSDRRYIEKKIERTQPLDGEWTLQELYFSGEKQMRQGKKFPPVVFNEGKLRAYGLGPFSFNYRVNSQLIPHQIDLFTDSISRTQSKPLRIRGIYKITDDMLEMVLPDPGIPRPTEFTKEPPEIHKEHCKYWIYYVLKKKPDNAALLKEVTQPLEDPPAGDADQPDRPQIQMKPAPELTPPKNSSNPLVTAPDDSQIDFKQIQEWIAQLDSNSQSQRRGAFESLTKAGPKALPAYFRLVKFLEGKISYEKGLAIDCLGAIGPNAAEAVLLLHKILKDKEASHVLRFKAANAMSKMGNPGEVAIPTLIEVLKDPGPSQKQRLNKDAAPEALGLMAPLIRKDDEGGYTDRRDQILVEVLGALGHYGPRAEQAIPAIEALRNAPETLPLIKRLCEKVLEHIGPSGESSKGTQP